MTTTQNRMLEEQYSMQRRSSSTVDVKLRKLDIDRVLAYLKNYAEKLISEGKALLIVLIGSLARGDYTAYSDADLVIIVHESSKKPHERIPEFIDPYAPLDIEPRVYTVEEFLKMAREGRRLVREVLEYGVVLAGDRAILEEARRCLSDSMA